MGQSVIKATDAPDDDRYFLWSSFVDAPVMTATRAEMLEYLDTPRRGEMYLRRGEAEKMMEAADTYGTSGCYPVPVRNATGRFDDERLHLMEGFTKSGTIARADLGTLWDRCDAEWAKKRKKQGDVPTDDLVEGFDDDD